MTENFNYPQNIHIEKYGVCIKPYLTFDEITEIAESMLSAEDYCDAEIKLLCGIIDNCVANPSQFDGCDVNMLMACGFSDAVKSAIVNLEEVYNYIAHAQSTPALISNFLANIEEWITNAQQNLPSSDEISKLIGQLNNK